MPENYAGPRTIANTASAQSSSDPNSANNTATATTRVIDAQADLAITKVAPSSVAPGGLITYDVKIVNNGPSVAQSVVLLDVLPGGTTFVSIQAPLTSVCETLPSGESGVIRCRTPTLAAEGSLVYQVVVQANADLVAGSTLTNVAVVSSPTPDLNLTNDRARTDTLVATPTAADLVLIKSDAPDPVVTGSTVTYTLTVGNLGPATATNVTLTDTLSAGLTLVSAIPSQGTCTAGTCELGSLAAGAGATVTLVASADGGGILTNAATVAAAETDPVPANNLVAAVTTTSAAADQADLVIEKVGPAVAAPGQAVVYFLRVTNRGPAPALNVEVQDTIPAGMTFFSNAGACISSFPCELETLAPGETRVIASTVLIDPAAATPVTLPNAVTIQSDITPDPDPLNNTASVATTVQPATNVDVAVIKNDSPDAIMAGDYVTYALTVINRGPGTASNVIVTDTLPPGLTDVTATPTRGTCSVTTTDVTCAIGVDMPAGNYSMIAVRGRAPLEIPTPNPMLNTAAIASDQIDSNPADNSATEPTTVIAPVDVQIVKTGPAAVQPGETFSYTLVVTNAGPASASNVIVADPLPAGLTFVAATAPCAGGFPCALGTLLPGASVPLTLTVTLAANAPPGTLLNTATVTSTSNELDPANNSSTVTTQVSLLTANVSIIMTGPTTVAPGGTIAFEIVVVNAGPSPAADVVISDATPPGLVFTSATGACTAFPCALGAINPGETRAITATYSVDPAVVSGQVLVNTASVASATADPSGADNTATVAVTVTASPPTPMPTLYFAEGASGRGFFETRYDVFNPNPTTPANITLRYFLQNGEPCPTASCELTGTLPPFGHRSLLASDTLGTGPLSFSAVVTSDVPVAAERTMTWDDEGRYGSQMETAVTATSTTWYVAEGATHSDFDSWYLVENPTDTATNVEIALLRPAPTPVERRTYTLPARSRFTIWVNRIPGFAATDVAASFTSLDGVPIQVEHAMYKTVDGLFWSAGEEGAAVPAPSTSWHFAEGATGSLFDTYLVLANPGATPAEVAVTYRLPDGTTIVRSHTVAPEARFTIHVNEEDGVPADTAIAASLSSTVPIVAERAMWWPGPTSATWYESHLVAGAVAPATAWAVASGELGGDNAAETYILVSNVSAAAGDIQIDLALEDGTTLTRTFPIAANGRLTVGLLNTPEFAAAIGQRFGVLIESVGPAPAPIVAEAAVYSSSGGVRWVAGRAAMATPVR